MRKLKVMHKLLFVALLGIALVMTGCSGDDGSNGAPGAAGTPGATGATGAAGADGVSTGTISGTITDSGTKVVIANGTVTLDPAVDGVTPAVNTDGTYTVADVPIGVYSITFSAPGYTDATATVSVVAGQTMTKDAALDPSASGGTGAVTTTVGTDTVATPGGTASVTFAGNGLSVQSVKLIGAPAGVTLSAVAATAAVSDSKAYTVTLPDVTFFKDQYFDVVASRVVESSGSSALIDRDMVMGINPFDLEEAGALNLKAEVTLSDGSTVEQDLEIAVALPFKDTTGLQNVPLGIPVLLHGVTDASWSMTAPETSKATLADADTQNPYFTPDVTGEYDLTDATSGATLKIFAGKWGFLGNGAVAGQASVDANGNPDPSMCGNCHGLLSNADTKARIASATAGWQISGHAEIFSQNLNAGGHYAEHCLQCHAVGWDLEVKNGGVDDQANYAAFLDKYFPASNGGMPIANPDNWTNLLNDYPQVASFTNIQCENCHGPNGSPLHNNADQALMPERFSYSSDLCGSCHGEPTHHGRFQEWQTSGHASYATADHAGARSGCAGCHSAQGAIAWLDQLAAGNSAPMDFPIDTLNAGQPLTTDNVQPQTCVTCHDPHNPGDVSGAHGTGIVRLNGNTPMLPSGFAAVGVGKGAVCFACHAGRRGETTDDSGNVVYGLHEDGNQYFGVLTSYGTAHHGPQGSVLMGRNAYFVQGVRGAHSNIENTCVNCHMDQIPGPAEFSNSAAQTNHTFKADLSICANCHGAGFNGQGVADSVDAETAVLSDAITSAVLKLNTLTLADGQTATLHSGHSGNYVEIDDASGVQVGNNVNLPALASTDAPDAPGQILAKALWNLSLVENDLSHGVHNPSFVHQVLNASIDKVNAL